MKDTAYNGSFVLGEVKKIHERFMGTSKCYFVTFDADSRTAVLTTKHCVLTGDGKPTAAQDLKKGDTIWINVYDLILKK